ncbi:hypothetical protein [Paraburkholderia sp. MM5384-R2]|uniref:hypothetical protein n=1 Tax=Paraburkholderia sp. MM5384-R2 TaxID=2723097 RepID=UPI00160FE628|nr:hypothetical protein [Paraburkholderia sp. MM5384-R2]MBB5503052.1 hypothetical protein [Paraburkholderia sp. MM5384-R2]
MTMHTAQEGRPAAWEMQHTTFLTTDGRWLEGCSAEGSVVSRAMGRVVPPQKGGVSLPFYASSFPLHLFCLSGCVQAGLRKARFEGP